MPSLPGADSGRNRPTTKRWIFEARQASGSGPAALPNSAAVARASALHLQD